MYSISICSVFSTRLSIYSFFWAWQVVVSAPACQNPLGYSSLNNSDYKKPDSSSVKYYNHSEDLQKNYRKKTDFKKQIYIFVYVPYDYPPVSCMDPTLGKHTK